MTGRGHDRTFPAAATCRVCAGTLARCMHDCGVGELEPWWFEWPNGRCIISHGPEVRAFTASVKPSDSSPFYISL